MLRPRPPRPIRPNETRPLAGLLAVCLLALTGCPFGERDDALILARRGDATSLAIARHYAARAGIPDERILELTLTIPLGAERIAAARYRAEIAEAIERHLVLTGSEEAVTRLIIARGLPLVVEDCAPDTASCRRATLDAALAQLGRTPEGRAFARMPNPYFRSTVPFEDFRDEDPAGGLRFLVSRLTASHAEGQTSDTVPRLLVEALGRPERPAEADAPAWHVAGAPEDRASDAAAHLLLDPIAQRLPLFGHRVCNGCGANAATGIVLAREGPLGPLPQLEGPGLVVSLTGHGPRSGEAVAAPLHAFVDRWLARGATGLSLHLGDPYLAEVARPQVQLERWARGRTAAEAHYASLPQLGGRHVFVGDGLRSLPPVDLPAALADDRDGDGVADARDNCPADANPDQRDTNADGFGNLCDADVDDDGDVDSSDGRIYPVDARGDLEAVTLTARNGPYDPDHDLDGDGRVDETDLLRVQLSLSRPPGG